MHRKTFRFFYFVWQSCFKIEVKIFSLKMCKSVMVLRVWEQALVFIKESVSRVFKGLYHLEETFSCFLRDWKVTCGGDRHTAPCSGAQGRRSQSLTIHACIGCQAGGAEAGESPRALSHAPC